jgi:hypothetical protein
MARNYFKFRVFRRLRSRRWFLSNWWNRNLRFKCSLSIPKKASNTCFCWKSNAEFSRKESISSLLVIPNLKCVSGSLVWSISLSVRDWFWQTIRFCRALSDGTDEVRFNRKGIRFKWFVLWIITRQADYESIGAVLHTHMLGLSCVDWHYAASPAFGGKFHFRSVLLVCDPSRWRACAGQDSLRSNGVQGRIIRQSYKSFCDKRFLLYYYIAAPPPRYHGVGCQYQNRPLRRLQVWNGATRAGRDRTASKSAPPIWNADTLDKNTRIVYLLIYCVYTEIDRRNSYLSYSYSSVYTNMSKNYNTPFRHSFKLWLFHDIWICA